MSVEGVGARWLTLRQGFNYALAVVEARLGVDQVSRRGILHQDIDQIADCWAPSLDELVKLTLRSEKRCIFGMQKNDHGSKLELFEEATVETHFLLMKYLHDEKIIAFGIPREGGQHKRMGIEYWSGTGEVESEDGNYETKAYPFLDYANDAYPVVNDVFRKKVFECNKIKIKSDCFFAALNEFKIDVETSSEEEWVFRRNGAMWEVGCNGRSTFMKPTLGLAIMAVLMSRPGVLIPWNVLHLMGGLVKNGSNLDDETYYICKNHGEYEEQDSSTYFRDLNDNNQELHVDDIRLLNKALLTIEQKNNSESPNEFENDLKKKLKKAYNAKRRLSSYQDQFRQKASKALSVAFSDLRKNAPSILTIIGLDYMNCNIKKDSRCASIIITRKIIFYLSPTNIESMKELDEYRKLEFKAPQIKP